MAKKHKKSIPTQPVVAPVRLDVTQVLRQVDLPSLIKAVKTGSDEITPIMIDFFTWYLTTDRPGPVVSSFLIWRALGPVQASQYLRDLDDANRVWSQDNTQAIQSAISSLLTSGIIKPSNIRELLMGQGK